MIVTTDIQTILYKDAQKLGIKKVYKDGAVPEGDVKSERVVIIVNSVEAGHLLESRICSCEYLYSLS